MDRLEEKIKSFARAHGVEVVGIAGPDRLNGPPSMDPTYTMRGARSIVSMVLPQNVDAIYPFLSKRSPMPHNLDQLLSNQRMHRVGKNMADFITSLGYRSRMVPPNNTYRRSLDVFATHPSFSHRFGAIAAGVAAQGWSGNVMTKQYGAAVYLGTVVTEAELESDPVIHPRYFIDNFCSRCKLCEKVCVAGMFDENEEEYVLINNQMHPRGKRLNIDFCNSSCFGLHAISRDKKWTTWGKHWIKEWTERMPAPSEKKYIRRTFLRKGAMAGDSTPRYDLIRRIGSILWPEELLEEMPRLENLPEDELERNSILADYAKKIGIVGLKDFYVLTCGQCAMICGPTLDETANRYHTLIESGLVVPGAEGRMVNAKTYAEAVEIRRKYPQKITREQMMKDSRASLILWHKYYFGIEPKSIVQGILYDRKLKKALKGLKAGNATAAIQG